jgi:methionine sulfoxide reductase heme-binding subunit
MAKAKPTGRIIAAASIGAFAAAGTGLWLAGAADHDGFQAAARLTARWSFVWFIVVWSASALARLWPGGWRGWLLYNRRGFGLAFASAHLIHAGFFLTAIFGFGVETSLKTVIGGGLGYVFVILLALTSHDYWVRALTPRGWKLLHTIGVNYIAIVFFVSYLGRLETNPPLAYATLGAMAVTLSLRIAAWLKARRPAAA